MNIPNKLSIFRLVLVPAFVAVFFWDFPGHYYVAGAIFLIAGATDILDGYIARKYNMITALGRVLDPLADKLLQLSALISLLVCDRLDAWVAILFIAKEIFMLLGGASLLTKVKDVPASNILGKAASFLFFAMLLVFICLPDVPKDIVNWCFLGTFVLVAAALVVYAIKFFRIVKAQKK